MNNTEQNRANRLEQELSEKQAVSKDNRPYFRMAKALELDAKDLTQMDDDVMNEQKMHLLQIAKNIKENNMQKSSKKDEVVSTETRKNNKYFSLKRPWYFWVGTFAVMAVILLAVIVNQNGKLSLTSFNRDSSFMGKATLSVVIPAVHAGDAFTVLADKGKNESAQTDTAFKVFSKVDVDEQTLKQSLRIVQVNKEADGMYIDFNLKKAEDGVYLLTPVKELDPGEVYKITIDAEIKEENEIKPREFSWAIQTQDTFRILNSTPGNQTGYVPVDTSIEVTMSKVGWAKPDQYFEITPKVLGRFEEHGRILAFIPEKPLAYETVYTVKYKAGWGIPEGKVLEKDVILQFETEAKPKKELSGYFDVWNFVYEAALKNEAIIPVSASDDLKNTTVSIIGYAISLDDAKQVISEIQSVPYWAYLSAQNKKIDVFKNMTNHQAFSLETLLESDEDSWEKLIRLPADVPRGWYVIKMTAITGQEAWILLQKSDVAAYSMIDKNNVLVWLVNHDTSKPLVNMEVSIDGVKTKTDAMGIAKLPTPTTWKEFETKDIWQGMNAPSSLVMIGDADNGLILQLQYPVWGWYFGDEDLKAHADNWSYLYLDRPLYNLKDEVRFFGFIQNRENHQGAGNISVEIRSNDMDFGTYTTKVLAKVDLKTDDRGFFDGKLAWSSDMSPGYYTIAVLKDGKDAYRRFVEIRDIVKPAYSISVIPNKQAVYAGETISGIVKATFYDGTPYAKLKLKMEGFLNESQLLMKETDDAGMAFFEYKTTMPNCTVEDENVYCDDSTLFTITATPEQGEEAEIYGNASVKVWRGMNSLQSENVKVANNNTEIKLKIVEIDSAKINTDMDSVFGSGVAGAEIESEVLAIYWDKIEVGNRYDVKEKKIYPIYNYNKRLESMGTYNLKTNSAGEAILKFPLRDKVDYVVISKYIEANGIQHTISTYVYGRAGYYSNYYDDSDSLSLESLGADKNDYNYKIGEKVEIGFVKNQELIKEDGSVFLFVKTQNGIVSHSAGFQPTYSFIFDEDDAPNVVLYGIAYSQGSFVQTRYDAYFDSEEKGLKVELSTDKNSYAPASQIVTRAKVTDKNGNAVKGVKVAISIVDEALLATAEIDMEPYILRGLYKDVSDGILTSNWSNQMKSFGHAGAEMGGSAGFGQVRKDFKDTAGFLILETDTKGMAEGFFTAPDNITSWRFTAVAISANRQAGENQISVPVTKPLFVDAVVPRYLAIDDKPVIKVRAHGAGLPSQGEIEYMVDIPTLGINEQMIKGQLEEPVYLAIDNLQPGKHKAIIGIKANGKMDAIEKTIEVAQFRTTKEVKEIVELAPGVSLPDPGVSTRIQLIFESKAKAQKRNEVWNLAHPWSARLESVLAGIMMKDLYEKYYGEEIEEEYSPLLRYQQVDGGISILPYASSDVELTAKVAATYPQAFDTVKMANYFWDIADNKESAREETIYALSGLASLGQPVLDRLKIVQSQMDLSWREKVALMRGLEASGNREVAKAILDELLKNTISNDDQMFVSVSKDLTETVEATLEIATIAEVLAYPNAVNLMNYVDAMWSHEVVSDLDKAWYLSRVVPALANVDVKISYMIGSQNSEIDLSKWPMYSLDLTAEEFRNFVVTSVNGPVAVSFTKRVSGDISESSPLINVTRNYFTDKGSLQNLHEGDIVNIEINIAWDDRAEDGCYIVHDRLPATLRPLLNVNYSRRLLEADWYPYEVTPAEASFVVCKSNKNRTIKYKARVISMGIYNTGGVLVQSMMTPNLASVSDPQIIEVK